MAVEVYHEISYRLSSGRSSKRRPFVAVKGVFFFFFKKINYYFFFKKKFEKFEKFEKKISKKKV